MSTVEGYVERIVYRNDDNGYSVLSVSSGGKEITMVGTFPSISQGEYLCATGEETEHPMYGPQLQVEEYSFVAPSDAESTERYLGSGAVKGVGAALAARIVRQFGDDTFRIIEEEPERLAEIKGISERRAMEIAGQVAEKRDMRKAVIFLQQYGISLNLAVKIYQQYGQELYNIIRQNPYRLADDIAGVGFKMADEIAAKAGIQADSDFRIKSGLLYTLMNASGQGHTYLPQEELVSQAAGMLQVLPEEAEKHIMDMVMDKRLVVKLAPAQEGRKRLVFSSSYYYMELNSAKMLHDLNVSLEVEEFSILGQIKKLEEGAGVELDPQQRMAVVEAVKNGLLILTGGPGTGKTTTINMMIRYFTGAGMDILLAAPTGRAAKRMTEATGYEAQTIHRLLEVSGAPEDGARSIFGKNEENPLEADVIIIDEMSMVDINLMHALLRAVPAGTRLILVGDVNQLPSVGPGNVLKDMIQSRCFHMVMLTHIFRQAAQSEIIVNAHRINSGERVEPNPDSRDFLFVRRNQVGNVVGATLTLVRDKLPGYVGVSFREIQVLTPMRKGSLGVESLNAVLQEHLNPPSPDKKEKIFAHCTLREGDKVMQIKNNYQLEWEIQGDYHIAVDRGMGVFNGDMGVVLKINLFAEQLTVEFEERRRVNYSFKQVEELELAYAVTIHKSQGSEYPAVVIPLLAGPRMLMNRNLLYTAVTRAKTCVTIVGSVETFQEMIDNVQEQRRYSGLADRIRELCALQEESQRADDVI